MHLDKVADKSAEEIGQVRVISLSERLYTEKT